MRYGRLFMLECVEVLLLAVSCTSFNLGILSLGDICPLSETKNGKCKLITQCQSAVDILRNKGTPPLTCGFNGTMPIVCCDEATTSIQYPATRPSNTFLYTSSTDQRYTTTTQRNIVYQSPPRVYTTTHRNMIYQRPAELYTTTTQRGIVYQRPAQTYTTTAQSNLIYQRPVELFKEEELEIESVYQVFQKPEEQLPVNVYNVSVVQQPTYTKIDNVELAKQKCTEYAQYVYDYESSPSDQSNRIRKSFCGTDATSPIRGYTAFPREFPHQALISGDPVNNVKCGGTLISEQYVLTAAHCFNSDNSNGRRFVLLGDLDIETTKDDAQPQMFSIVQVIKHPQYNPSFPYHDIALVKLDKPVQFNRWIRPACLNTESVVKSNAYILSGWGPTVNGVVSNAYLRQAKFKSVASDRCSNEYNRIFRNVIDSARFFCAEETQVDPASNLFFTGNPLQVYNQDIYCMYDVVGVASVVSREHPTLSLYTKVSNYLPWIARIAWS